MSNLLSGLDPSYFGPLPDRYIKELIDKDIKLIDPFIPNLVKEILNKNDNSDKKKLVSYGLSSYGYDMRVSDEFKVFTPIGATVSDPKNMVEENFVTVKTDTLIIPPNSYVLCRSIERFDLPRDITGICFGKSTYARAGLVANLTPLEAGWCGYLTIEIANCSPIPAKIYANEGICQVVFLKGYPCEISYEDRGGKYNNQKAEVTLAKV